MSKSLERIALAVALVLLISLAGWLAYSFPSVADIVGFPNSNPKGNAVKKLGAEELAARLAPWNSPVLWKDNKNRLFNSVDVLFFPAEYPDGAYLKVLDGTATPRSSGGVLLQWYTDHGISINDANVDREDPDNDGFSNIVEYRNDQTEQRTEAKDNDGSKSTNPNDSQNHPPYLSRLRLKEYESRPFKLTFNSYSKLNGEYVFQIHIDGVSSDKQPPLKKTGDKLDFENFIIGDFHLNIITKFNPAIQENEQVDESWLEVKKPEIDLVLKLPFQKAIDAPESTANFVMLMPSETDKVIKVQIGKNLVVPFMPDDKFIVISVDDNGANIKDLKTNKQYHILKLDPKEWDEVPAPH